MPTRYLIAFFGFGLTLVSAQDTLVITEAVIQSGFSDGPQTLPKNLTVLPEEILQNAAQPALDGLLESVPGLDARQRGPFGAQTDLSLRGGSF